MEANQCVLLFSAESEANLHLIPGHPIFGCQYILCILCVLGTATPPMVSAELSDEQSITMLFLLVCSLIFLAPHFTVDLWNLIWSIWVTGKFVCCCCVYTIKLSVINRLHHSIWNHGSESISDCHIFTTTPNQQEKQVLHVAGVHFPVLPDTGTSSSLGPLPLQSCIRGSVCCANHCCLPHD